MEAQDDVTPGRRIEGARVIFRCIDDFGGARKTHAHRVGFGRRRRVASFSIQRISVPSQHQHRDGGRPTRRWVFHAVSSSSHSPPSPRVRVRRSNASTYDYVHTAYGAAHDGNRAAWYVRDGTNGESTSVFEVASLVVDSFVHGNNADEAKDDRTGYLLAGVRTAHRKVRPKDPMGSNECSTLAKRRPRR